MSNLPKIEGAILFSINEAKTRLIEKERAYKDWWWLRTPEYSQMSATYVNEDGSVRYGGVDVDINSGCVRPALRINLKNSDLKTGDAFVFGDKFFKIVSKDLAFCLEDIGYCCFRDDWNAPDANDYEVSDVKKFVDTWFKEAMQDENDCE